MAQKSRAPVSKVHKITSKAQWENMLNKAGDRVVVVQFFEVGQCQDDTFGLCRDLESRIWHSLAETCKLSQLGFLHAAPDARLRANAAILPANLSDAPVQEGHLR